MDKQKQIIFHIGLAKVASTFLQNSIFPKFKGVYFIKKLRYRLDRKIISTTNHPIYLLSREFDWKLEKNLKGFSDDYPNAKIILILRQHDDWIASQYRRYTKNGGSRYFDGYLNIHKDSGVIKKEELYFMSKIKIVERYFKPKPLVLIYSDLKKDPFAFIDKIAEYIGIDYNKTDISTRRVHKSYNDKQLKIMRNFGRWFIPQQPKWAKNKLLYWLQRRSRLLISYLVLYPSLLIPAFLVSKKNLIPDDQLEEIKDYYRDDWEKCLEYSKT